jgi:GxxExxY protein
MSYNIAKLSDVNPPLVTDLKNRCYTIIGLCQQVHRELGPFLNEYMYQEALAILFTEREIPYQKEYYFTVSFHGHTLQHKHYADFLCKGGVIIECKAVDALGTAQRQQLWNYMRLTKVPIGLLVNFAPVMDQCEHYYLDTDTGNMYLF